MLEGRALGGGSGLGKQKEGQSRYPGRTEGGALLLPRGLAAGFSARKVFSRSWHVFKHPAPQHGRASPGLLDQGRSASPGPCAFPVMEKEKQGLLGLDTPAELSNNMQSGASIYCNFHLNCLSGSMYWYKCFH